MPNTPTLWNIPYQRNPFFTGREDVLFQLHRALHTENAVALSHPQGVSGLGGIGKTQLALEYAYRYAAEYDAVLWARADSALALTSSFGELAHVLNLPERNEQDQNSIVEAVLRWFRRFTGWLLVFDNIDCSVNLVRMCQCKRSTLNVYLDWEMEVGLFHMGDIALSCAPCG